MQFRLLECFLLLMGLLISGVADEKDKATKLNLPGIESAIMQIKTTEASTLQNFGTELSNVANRALQALVLVLQETRTTNQLTVNAPGVTTAPRLIISNGFIIDPEGYLICPAAGVPGKGPFVVQLSDETRVWGQKVGEDQVTNLALLKIDKIDENQRFPMLGFGNADALQIATTAILVGSPRVNGNGIVVGTISSKEQHAIISKAKPRWVPMLQFNGLVRPGDSGSPLLNSRGEVIGVWVGPPGTERSGTIPTISNNGFAIPSDIVQRVVNELRTYGKVQYAKIGISYGTAPRGGVQVNNLLDDSPAGRAGLQPTDLIIAFNDMPLPNGAAFTRAIFNAKPGQTVQLKFVRNNEQHAIEVKLGKEYGN